MEENRVIVNSQTYTKAQVEDMSIEEIEQLIEKIKLCIGEVAIKKQAYRNNNKEEANSPEFWKKMASYKTVNIKLQSAMCWIGNILKQKRMVQHADRERWFFSFYKEVEKTVSKKAFNKLVEETNNQTGYGIII